MSNGFYANKGTGYSTLPQQVTQTPFGNVVTSGGIYKGNQEASYSSLGNGWGTAYFSSATPTSSSSGVTSGSGATQVQTPTAKQNAENAYQSMIDTVLGGYNNAVASSNNINSILNSAQSSLGDAKIAASNITPLAQSLTNIGNSQMSIYDQLMGNAESNGAVKDYLDAIGLAADAALKINPDNYVSMAASDVQGSFDNALGQYQRNLSRQGVSAGSGAASARLQEQFQQSLATALAAAKTRARQSGLEAQQTALTNRASLYKNVLDSAQSAQQSGATNLASAAGLYNTKAGVMANIGGVEVNFGNLELNNNSAVQSAISNVAAAQKALADFYANTMDKESTTIKSGNNYTHTVESFV